MALNRITLGRLCVLVLAGMALVGTAMARAPFPDDEPWYLLNGDRVFAVDSEIGDDDETGWQTSNLGFLVSLPTSSKSSAYLRWRFRSFDDQGYSALERWPEIAHADADSVDLLDWSDERRHAGWGRPEIGMLGIFAFPGLGSFDYTGSTWMPFADNKLFPFAARSVSLRFSLRKRVVVAPHSALFIRASRLLTMGAAGDFLSDEASRPRNVVGAGWIVTPAVGWRGVVAWQQDRGEAESRQGFQLELGHEVTKRGVLVLSWQHVGDGEDGRPWADRYGLSWRMPIGTAEDTDDEAEDHTGEHQRPRGPVGPGRP